MSAALAFSDEVVAIAANDNHRLNRPFAVIDPEERRSNGAGTLYEYSDASRLTLLNHDLSGAANDANWAFSYTDAGQLESRSWIQAYEWPVEELDEEYERNGLNQYTEVDEAAYNYDARGNLISDGSRNFEYDLENRLISASGSVEGELRYDPLGRLRSFEADEVTTEFLYDGDTLIAEYVEDEIARRYAHGAGVDEPLVWYESDDFTDPRWLIADRQGSIVAVTDDDGAATIYRYGPYGEPESWTGPRFGYTGQAALSELQLYHYKARAYDPHLGRFAQTDPVGYEDDLNLYVYVRNDPANATDPTGREIVIGSDDLEFMIDVALAIGEILSEPGGAQLLDDLHSSEHVFLIVPGERNETFFTSPENAKNGVGSGAVITFNPDQTRGNRDETGSETRPAFIGLIHELGGHAWAGERGEDPGSRYEAEVDAISRENIVRAEHGLPLAVPPPPPNRDEEPR